MEAYAGGLKAMKSALNALPMSKEELEDLMDQIQDVCVFTLIVLYTLYVYDTCTYTIYSDIHTTQCVIVLCLVVSFVLQLGEQQQHIQDAMTLTESELYILHVCTYSPYRTYVCTLGNHISIVNVSIIIFSIPWWHLYLQY